MARPQDQGRRQAVRYCGHREGVNSQNALAEQIDRDAAVGCRRELISEEGEVQRGQNEGHSAVALLVILDSSSGMFFALVAANKGVGDDYEASVVRQWMERLGHRRVLLQTDDKSTVKALAKNTPKRAVCDVVVRTSPPGSPASLTIGEHIQKVIAGQLRSLKKELEDKSCEGTSLGSRWVPLLVHHCSWGGASFHHQGSGGHTAYSRLNGAHYRGQVCHIGGTVIIVLALVYPHRDSLLHNLISGRYQHAFADVVLFSIQKPL